MAGGKTRTLCEDTFSAMLDYPGLTALLCRANHTSIVETTKKTMLTQVMPPEVYGPDVGRVKASMGEDYVQIFNGSVVHFVGLDNPLRWFSAEIGLIGFDESQEIHEDPAVKLITRLRQRCSTCIKANEKNCKHFPHRASFTFNPSSPGHWLQQWFLLGGEQTEHGFYKPELFTTGATAPIGDAEFIFSKATDNPYLPDGYIEQTLAGLPERLRRRYLDGLWEFTEGNGFFDTDALGEYEREAHNAQPLLIGRTIGSPEQDFAQRNKKGQAEDPVRFRKGAGPWSIWAKPDPAKRYVMAIDTSSGGGYDYSAIQIICIEDFEQVAEFQGKLTPTDLAVEAYRAGRVFNNALAVPEITGGWGFTIEQELKRMHYPRLYTRKVLDRLSKKWTDKTGWDTTQRTRAHMLDTLERCLREREFKLYSLRSVAELATFVYGKNNKPQAQDGCNDDLVVALAIAVTVALDLPKQLRLPKRDHRQPQFSVTGY